VIAAVIMESQPSRGALSDGPMRGRVLSGISLRETQVHGQSAADSDTREAGS